MKIYEEIVNLTFIATFHLLGFIAIASIWFGFGYGVYYLIRNVL